MIQLVRIASQRGTYMSRYRALLIFLALLAGACSTQTSAASSVVDFSGCKVDLREICETIYKQPTFTLNGQQTDARQLEQRATPHYEIMWPFKYPNGDLIANLDCMMDLQQRTVSYARLLPGPPITDKEIQYVRANGFCFDEPGQEEKALKQLQENASPNGN